MGMYIGTITFTIALLILGWLYNECEGGSNALARNAINACAVVCFVLGATVVAYRGNSFAVNHKGQWWYWVITAVVFSTLHVQDFCDQEGDRHRGCLTIPLLIGDAPGRWTIVVPILVWSCFAPSFWRMSVNGYLLPLGVGGVMSWRMLWCKGVEEDRTTYELWGRWITILLAIPSVAL